MKKQLVASLAAAMVLGVAGTSFAAANPFVDVPAKHWAYASVMTLSQAGIVDGYGDGKFQGDKMISRYEMAQIVAKAMAKSDKADAKQKAEIEKLSAEFAEELNVIGVRVSALEKKVSNIKFNGFLRTRMESDDNTSGTEYKTRLRLALTAPLDTDWTFKARYGQESKAGEVNGNAQVDQAYVTGKAFGLTEVSLGRMPLYLGKGLVMDSSANWDGLKIGAGNEVKVFAGIAKKNYNPAVPSVVKIAKATDTDPAAIAAGVGNPYNSTAVDVDNRAFVFANATYVASKNVDLTASYFADQGKKSNYKTDYETWGVGGTFKVAQNVAVTAEYAKNGADNAKDAKAQAYTVKYKGASFTNVGSFGLSVGYNKAEAGFDPKGYTTADVTDAYKAANDMKGMQYNVEYTVFKNGIFNLQYNPATNYAGTKDQKFVIANLNYVF